MLGSPRSPARAQWAPRARTERWKQEGRTPAPEGRRVLIVDTDAEASTEWTRLLEENGFDVRVARDGGTALATLDRGTFEVVLLDLHAPVVSGLSVLSALPALHTDARFIVTTHAATVDSAVEAMKLGAFDYVMKSIVHEDLLLLVGRANDDAMLGRAAAGPALAAQDVGPAGLVGRAPPMRRLLDQVARVAPTRASVLITGETGTGKELVARAIHELSDRADGPFVAVNCSALPETLLEAELFGHEKGSFTGAVQTRRGLIEAAARGTLFLDEVSTLSEDIQIKLLRVLQDRHVQRVGSSSHARVDFRLVAATNADLAGLVRAGSFREDLYYRLHVFPLRVPPLRERREDIALLANHFTMRSAQENGLEPPRLTAHTVSRMMAYDWPGNVRELESFIERSVILYAGGRVLPFDLPGTDTRNAEDGLLQRAEEEDWTLDRLEREHILAVLDRVQWQQAIAARLLGVNRRTIYRKLKRYREEGLIPDAEIEPDGGALLERGAR